MPRAWSTTAAGVARGVAALAARITAERAGRATAPYARRPFVVLAALAVLASATACSDPEPPTPTPTPPAPPATPTTSPNATPAQRAAALAATLGDADLVGQVLMPYAYGSNATRVSEASATANRGMSGVSTPAEMIAKFRLGGLILVGFSADDPTATSQPTTNVDSPRQVHELTAGLQHAATGLPAQVPLLIGTDQEFGVVTRVKDGVTALPSAMAFGAARNAKLTEAAWRAAGTELAALGVNVDFAPVADVIGNTGAGVIGSRSYGSDPAVAAQQVAAAVRGLQASGVAATLKHFPGHGHTTTDSHAALPVLAQSRAALERDDFPPFAAGIGAGAGLVMSGHLDARAVEPGVPATFSHKALVDVLRGQLKFGGVVVTDALNMPPAKRWAPAEAARRALLAGNDLLLMPPDLAAVHAGLTAALRDGSVPRARLVEAVTRVLTLKFRFAAGPPRAGLDSLNAPAHVAAVAALNRAAVTQMRGRCGGRPVGGTITVTASGGRDRARDWLVESLRAAGIRVVDSGGTVVHLVGYGDGPGDLRADAAATVAMDTPFLLGSARSGVLLATYSSTRLAMAALAAVLAGRARPTGRSPVAVPGLPRASCA